MNGQDSASAIRNGEAVLVRILILIPVEASPSFQRLAQGRESRPSVHPIWFAGVPHLKITALPQSFDPPPQLNIVLCIDLACAVYS
jgi:hypothetical protein